MTSANTVKIRVIDQRYGTDPEGFEMDRNGNKISTYDKPLINASTGQLLVNGGTFARFDSMNPDPKMRKVRQYTPGSVIEVPEDEARQLCAEVPNVIELLSDYEARMKRIEERKRPKAGAEYELAAFMQQTSAEDEAARNLRRLQEEKRLADLRGLGVGASQSSLEQRLAELQAKLDRLIQQNPAAV